MPDDKHAKLRSLPFEMLAGALSIDISRFKRRKGDTESAGPCPVHAPKKNGTAFSYSQDGKFNCFSCNAKGRGGLDLAMAVRGCGFQAAVELLEPYAAVPDMCGPRAAGEATAGDGDGEPAVQGNLREVRRRECLAEGEGLFAGDGEKVRVSSTRTQAASPHTTAPCCSKLRIPAHGEQPFRSKVNTDSDRC